MRDGRRARTPDPECAVGGDRVAMQTVAAIRHAGRTCSDGEWRVVLLADGRSFRVDAEEIARAGLAPGESIPDELLDRLVWRDQYWRAREAGVRLLAGRARSADELRRRFRRDGVPQAVAEAVLTDLGARGYLDDLAFARSWIASRLDRTPCGSARLRGELRQRGVALGLIEQAIQEAYGEEGISVGEEQYAAAVVARRSRAYASLPPDARARRMAGFLERRGFAPATIARALGAMKRRSAEDADD